MHKGLTFEVHSVITNGQWQRRALYSYKMSQWEMCDAE